MDPSEFLSCGTIDVESPRRVGGGVRGPQQRPQHLVRRLAPLDADVIAVHARDERRHTATRKIDIDTREQRQDGIGSDQCTTTADIDDARQAPAPEARRSGAVISTEMRVPHRCSISVPARE